MRPLFSSPAARSLVQAALALVLAGGLPGCKDPLERAFTFSSDAPSRTGLVGCPAGVVLGNDTGAVMLVDPNGRQVWRTSLGREVVSRPVVTGGLVVAGTTAGEWMGLSLADGTEQWRLGAQPPLLTALVTDEARAFGVGADGSVWAVDVASGTVLWHRPGVVELKNLRSLRRPPPPALTEDAVVVAIGEWILALRIGDGTPVWKLKAVAIGLDALDQQVFYVTDAGAVVALSAETGAVLWTRKLEAKAVAGPFVANRELWIGLEPSRLEVLDPEKGATAWSATLPADLGGGVAWDGHHAYVPTRGPAGKLVVFKPDGAVSAEMRVDSALRSAPLIQADQLVLGPADGRVLGFKLLSPEK